MSSGFSFFFQIFLQKKKPGFPGSSKEGRISNMQRIVALVSLYFGVSRVLALSAGVSSPARSEGLKSAYTRSG
jgi:hypothetical protein